MCDNLFLCGFQVHIQHLPIGNLQVHSCPPSSPVSPQEGGWCKGGNRYSCIITRIIQKKYRTNIGNLCFFWVFLTYFGYLSINYWPKLVNKYLGILINIIFCKLILLSINSWPYRLINDLFCQFVESPLLNRVPPLHPQGWSRRLSWWTGPQGGSWPLIWGGGSQLEKPGKMLKRPNCPPAFFLGVVWIANN